MQKPYPPVSTTVASQDPTGLVLGLPDPAAMVPELDPAAMMKGGPQPTGDQPLKLKDFLPFMKPKTFGADKGKIL